MYGSCSFVGTVVVVAVLHTTRRHPQYHHLPLPPPYPRISFCHTNNQEVKGGGGWDLEQTIKKDDDVLGGDDISDGEQCISLVGGGGINNNNNNYQWDLLLRRAR